MVHVENVPKGQGYVTLPVSSVGPSEMDGTTTVHAVERLFHRIDITARKEY